MKPAKCETATSQILRLLTEADDFMTAKQVQALTGRNLHQVQVTLDYLRARHAVALVEAGKALWWYATPMDDNRTWTVKERAPEDHPRVRRKGKKAPV